MPRSRFAPALVILFVPLLALLGGCVALDEGDGGAESATHFDTVTQETRVSNIDLRVRWNERLQLVEFHASGLRPYQNAAMVVGRGSRDTWNCRPGGRCVEVEAGPESGRYRADEQGVVEGIIFGERDEPWLAGLDGVMQRGGVVCMQLMTRADTSERACTRVPMRYNSSESTYLDNAEFCQTLESPWDCLRTNGCEVHADGRCDAQLVSSFECSQIRPRLCADAPGCALTPEGACVEDTSLSFDCAGFDDEVGCFFSRGFCRWTGDGCTDFSAASCSTLNASNCLYSAHCLPDGLAGCTDAPDLCVGRAGEMCDLVYNCDWTGDACVYVVR